MHQKYGDKIWNNKKDLYHKEKNVFNQDSFGSFNNKKETNDINIFAGSKYDIKPSSNVFTQNSSDSRNEHPHFSKTPFHKEHTSEEKHFIHKKRFPDKNERSEHYQRHLKSNEVNTNSTNSRSHFQECHGNNFYSNKKPDRYSNSYEDSRPFKKFRPSSDHDSHKVILDLKEQNLRKEELILELKEEMRVNKETNAQLCKIVTNAFEDQTAAGMKPSEVRKESCDSFDEPSLTDLKENKLIIRKEMKDFQTYSEETLKTICDLRSLPTYGSKQELVTRVMQYKKDLKFADDDLRKLTQKCFEEMLNDKLDGYLKFRALKCGKTKSEKIEAIKNYLKKH